MKYILLPLILLLSCNAIAQTAGQSQKDSLRNVIANTEGQEKLDAFVRLTTIYLMETQDEQKRDTLFTLYDAMDAEAEQQGNDILRATIRLNRLNAYINIRQYDEIISLAPDYLEFAAKKQVWNLYYQLYTPLVVAYRNKGDNAHALALVSEMYEHAKARQFNPGMGLALFNMSQVYNRQRRFTEQEECLRECMVLIKDSEISFAVLPRVYTLLGYCLVAQKRYDEAIRHADEMEAVIRRSEEKSGFSMPDAWIERYLVYLGAYRQTDQADEAEFYCNLIDSISNGTMPLYEERAAIFLERGQYEEALEMADKALETVRPEGRIQAMGGKMMVLLRKGDVEGSELMFHEIIIALTERHNAQMNAQLDEIRTHYEVDKINAEKERIRNYLLFALAGCLLLAILLGVYIYYSRLVTNKNRGLYRQIKEQDSLAKELERMKHLYETEAAVIPEAESVAAPAGNRQQQQLVAQFHKYIQGEPNDIRPDKIDLDKMVADLATNRTYLFEAVKAVTDKTPVDYIYSMRLEEAKQLLEARLDLNVEVIAEECGFNSRSTFYRLFRERYQISPTMYRKMAREKV